MTNFDKFGRKYCDTCKYDYRTDALSICNYTIKCCKCPNHHCALDENDYTGCRCLEEAAIDANICPYYEENRK